MSAIFERRSFKIIFIATSTALVLGLSAGFIGVGIYKRIQREREVQAQKDADWEYREKFRVGLDRIRQNLKLDHFLAAYKSLERLSYPPKDDTTAKSEYGEILNRIGRGLLQNQLLKESGEVFQMLREFEGHENFEIANKAISEIESKKRIESARLHYDQGLRLYEEKKYHDSFGEYQKADVDLNSVESLKFDDIKEEKTKLIAAMKDVKFFLYIESAHRYVQETRDALKSKDYSKVQSLLGKAAGAVGRAAFFRPDAEVLKGLRDSLADLDAELGYQLPNSTPIFNRASEEMLGREPRIFRLTGYEFDPNPDEKNAVKIDLKYIRDNNEPFYIVRYRIYFVNNKDFFNGHFIMPDVGVENSALAGHVIYRQEIPEKFKGVSIQRIEVKVYNSDDVIVSHITRAFRRHG